MNTTLPQNTLRTAPTPVTRRENTLRIAPSVHLTPVQRIGKWFAECHEDMNEADRLFAYEFCGKMALRWALAAALLTVWILTA